jgi:hypothetical protein
MKTTEGKMEHLPAVFGTLIPIAGIAWLAVVVWLGTRQKEKEDFHRSEVLKKIAETPGDAAQKVLEMMRQQEDEAKVRRREGIKLGGLITLAVGIGLMIFLFMIERKQPVWTVGLIPLLVGAALFGYAAFMSPKQN